MNLLSLFVIPCLLCYVTAKYQCLNEDNIEKEWYVVYKYPEVSGSSDPWIHKGLGHVYADLQSKEWTTNKKSLNESGHAIYNTLQQIYDGKEHGKKDFMYIMYNDQPPTGHYSTTHGHTKGVLAFDKDQGFWLVHSLPHFPPAANSSYAWPATGLRYGQSFLCLTLSYNDLDKIAKQLIFSYPKIYDSFAPAEFLVDNPNLSALMSAKQKHPTSEPWNNTEAFTTSDGQVFMSRYKYSKYGKDIYDSWLAPAYQSEMFAETWQNGRGKLPSSCQGDYKVYNIQNMTVNNVLFKETQDHSKWAVTDEEQAIVCIGGINRQHEQMFRAGGLVCTKSNWLWGLYNATIAGFEPCNQTRPLDRILNDVNSQRIKL